MIVEYKFEKFEFKAFLDFIWDMIYTFQIGQIKFNPHQGGSLFNNRQLTHIGPKFDLDNQGDFLYAWSRNKNIVRTVTYDQFHINGIPRIEVTFDLDIKTMVLESTEGIEIEAIEKSLNKFFKIKKVSNKSDTNKWWKYSHPAWWIWFAMVSIFKDGLWALLKLAWKHKWITGIILLFIVPLIVQLFAIYLSHKWGWNK